MDDGLTNVVDSNDGSNYVTPSDTVMSPNVFLVAMLTASLYDFNRALPIHVSPPERIVKKKLNDFTGLAKITVPYMPIAQKSSNINDAINVQNHSYACLAIPTTHLNEEHISVDSLSTIPHSDFVGIKKYVFNPLDENYSAEFDMDFRKDINSLKFCDANMADKFSVLIQEAFRKQTRMPLLNENHVDPIPVYVFFIDNKYSIKHSDAKVNGSSPGSKSIYLLHCNSDTNPDQYNHRHRITH